ncbi:unnamed protein product [Phytophthora lilii]|uniref:Unnamed protein product n=1 Tax=Phytophthora lilii TaxID=2077276 RepID=A0A9W6TGK0_9STRA|nr:unnamed protein product [Phytophthora lilii]
MEELKLMTSGAFGSGSDNGSGDLQSLRQEFAQYRKRALNAVEQKEKELSDIQAHYHENGGGSNNASRTNSFKEVRVRRMSMESNSSLSGFETPNATKTNEYLKNIVYKYMASDQDEVRVGEIVCVCNFYCLHPVLMPSLRAIRRRNTWKRPSQPFSTLHQQKSLPSRFVVVLS